MPFSWGSLRVLMVQIFCDQGPHIKIRLRNLFLLGFSWGSLGVLTSKSGTGFEVRGAFCCYVDWSRIHYEYIVEMKTKLNNGWNYLNHD